MRVVGAGRGMQDNWATTGVATGGGMQSIRKLVQVPYLENIGRGTFAKQAPTFLVSIPLHNGNQTVTKYRKSL